MVDLRATRARSLVDTSSFRCTWLGCSGGLQGGTVTVDVADDSGRRHRIGGCSCGGGGGHRSKRSLRRCTRCWMEVGRSVGQSGDPSDESIRVLENLKRSRHFVYCLFAEVLYLWVRENSRMGRIKLEQTGTLFMDSRSGRSSGSILPFKPIRP